MLPSPQTGEPGHGPEARAALTADLLDATKGRATMLITREPETGAASRSQAIARARELRLLEG